MSDFKAMQMPAVRQTQRRQTTGSIEPLRSFGKIFVGQILPSTSSPLSSLLPFPLEVRPLNTAGRSGRVQSSEFCGRAPAESEFGAL